MAGFFKKMFSFGKGEVVDGAAETPDLRTDGDELKPIDWAALRDLTKEDDVAAEAKAAEETAAKLAEEQAAQVAAEKKLADEAAAERAAQEAEQAHLRAEQERAEVQVRIETATREAEAPKAAEQARVEAERQKAKAEADKAAADKAAQDDARRTEEARAAAERDAANKAAQDAVAQEAVKRADDLAAKQAEADATEQAQRKAEQDRLEAEQQAAEEAARAAEVRVAGEKEAARKEAADRARREAEAKRDAEAKRIADEKATEAAKASAYNPGLRTGGEELLAPAWMTQQNAPAAPKLNEPEPEPEDDSDPTNKVLVGKAVEQKQARAAPVAEAKLPWFERLRAGMLRSSRELSNNISGVFTKRKLDEDTLQDLEDVLLRADLGMEIAMRVTDSLSESRYGREVSDLEVRAVMGAEIEKVLRPVAKPLELDLSHKPHVILVVGVNGTGKTTTIGKLAAKLTEGGLSVMLAAGDTFRAAAIEQLKIWGERTGAPVVSSKLGADAAGLAYDAFEQAKAEGKDVLIIDTAGRLQNKTELMAELEKIVRVLSKLDPEAPHTVLQTIDATTGQNALNQVEIFRNIAGVNGLVLTKLDGTARGGILVAIAAKHKLPVYFIGVGEQVDDLEPFVAGDFAKAIAGVG